MIIETSQEYFSISMLGRKQVCRLAYSVNNLENFVASNAKFLLARKPTPCATFVTQLTCYTLGRRRTLKRSVAICTTLLRPELRKSLGISTPTSQQVQMDILVEKREEFLTLG